MNMEERVAIRNRKGQRIVVLLERAEPARSLAFVMHGLGGSKDQPHIKVFAEAFREEGFTVVRFDTTNTLGESDGRMEDATTTNYYEDLEDVIAWAKEQSWYREPYALAGHSLGGICTALYAERHPEEVLALAPISTVVSGRLSMEARQKRDPEGLRKWRETGWQEEESVSRPGLMKRLPWSHMEDRLTYDLLPGARNLTMPVLLIVGENDDSTPPQHQRLFYAALPGPKELHVIEGAPHTFRSPVHLREVKDFFLSWIASFPDLGGSLPPRI